MSPRPPDREDLDDPPDEMVEDSLNREVGHHRLSELVQDVGKLFADSRPSLAPAGFARPLAALGRFLASGHGTAVPAEGEGRVHARQGLGRAIAQNVTRAAL